MIGVWRVVEVGNNARRWLCGWPLHQLRKCLRRHLASVVQGRSSSRCIVVHLQMQTLRDMEGGAIVEGKEYIAAQDQVILVGLVGRNDV